MCNFERVCRIIAIMEERDFIILDTLNNTRNITKAAEILLTTQSSLSKRILLLEDELGIKLMFRSRHGIRFTPEGEIVLRYTKRASFELQEMRNCLDEAQRGMTSTLNAGISVNYARYILPDLLCVFGKEHPEVTVHINTDQSRNIFVRLVNREIDIAIVRGSYDWKGGKTLLSTENICAVLSKEDKDRALSDIPYIGRKTDAAFDFEITQWMRENNLKPETGIYVDSIETCTEMVKRGLGWAIVPEICLKDFDGEVRRLKFSDGSAFIRPTYLLYSEEAGKLPQVTAFIETVSDFHRGLLKA